MDVRGKTVAVTGAASGIGTALARRFALAGARHVAAIDIDAEGASRVAAEIGGIACVVDVSDEAALIAAVRDIESDAGPVDIFCSNAGILPLDPAFAHPAATPDHLWRRGWDVNVMAHVYAARAVLPGMVERGEGHLLQTVSAAGLLTMIGSAVYATTKHAAIGFAESLAIAYGDKGIGVSVLAPQAVATPMTNGKFSFGADADGILSADQVAQAALHGIKHNRFLILPHSQVAEHYRRKAADPERWIGHLRRIRRGFNF